MRIAISTDGDRVAPHFGRCEAYTLVDIDEQEITRQARIPNPGHQPGFRPGYLAERGVACIVAGGMGPRAQTLFGEKGIQTVVGVSSTLDETVDALRRDELRGGESLCNH